MSKGSNARPYSVPRETFADNFDAIFKKRTPEQQATEELGPYVPRSSPAHGAEEGGDTPED